MPIDVGRGRDVHFLVSHPTPPVFDGPEDRNGTRNFDEIRFWADYITPGPASRYIYDDAGRRGGLGRGAPFVIAGDQNSDPLDGDSVPGAIQQLLDHWRVTPAFTPTQRGRRRGGAAAGRREPRPTAAIPRFDTADFADGAPGNLRADYVLPSWDLRIDGGGVFWPRAGRAGLGAHRRVPVPVLGPPPRVRRRPPALTRSVAPAAGRRRSVAPMGKLPLLDVPIVDYGDAEADMVRYRARG